MKILCQAGEFTNALNKVSRAISSKKTYPILECIKLSAYNDILKLSATDGELSIEKKIKANVFIEGEIAIPYKTFIEYARKFPDGDIEINATDGKKADISFDSNITSFNCMDVEDFPEIKEINKISSLIISAKEFKKLINSIIYAVAIDDARPIYKGCYLELLDKTLTAVALDGYRMSINSLKNDLFKDDFNIIIPARSLNEILRLIEDNEENVTLVINKGQIMINQEHTLIISRLIEGEYISYKSIIPQEFLTEIKISTESFKNAMERASLISRNEKSNIVKFDFEANNMSITAKSDNVGAVNENILVEKTGKDLSISFNAKFISECLNAINEDYIVIKIKSGGIASLFIPLGNPEHINLILPIRNTY